jgi:hypothetical protein
VVEQVAEADSAALAEAPGEELAEAVVERDPVLGDELQHDRGDEALRDAPDPERVLRSRASPAELGLPGDDDDALAVPLDERDDGGNLARGDEPVGGALEQLGLGGRRSRAGENGAGQRAADDREKREQSHSLCTRADAAVLHGYVLPARGV